GEREFLLGDRVICRRNDGRMRIRNGTRATITAIGDDALALRTDGGMVRTIDLGYAAEHLEHGYALTGHAAQGATLERAYVLLCGQAGLQEWGYVACSRARTETHLYLAEVTPERETHAREPRTLGPTEHAARALATPTSEPLATDHADARNDRRKQILAT